RLGLYSGWCGWALARAHAKSGDAAMISGYLGSNDRFDKAIAKFASAYEKTPMKTKLIIGSLGIALILSANAHEPADKHGWINNETLKTRFGDFEFKNGYPAGNSAERLLDQLKLNRAIEVYLTQMMPVSAIATREGMRKFGQTKS